MNRRRASFPLAFAMLLSPAFGGEKHPKAPAPAPKPPAAAKAPAPEPGAQRGGNRDPHPGDRAVQRLQEMTPEQRQKFLSTLPETRRQRIEKELQNVAKMPPAAQNRVRSQLERLNNLPQQRQGQVRRSLQQFNDLPMERKSLISQELQRMSAMPDEERRAHMNSEEFRNRYSPTEQQMMGNLSEILPQ